MSTACVVQQILSPTVDQSPSELTAESIRSLTALVGTLSRKVVTLERTVLKMDQEMSLMENKFNQSLRDMAEQFEEYVMSVCTSRVK